MPIVQFLDIPPQLVLLDRAGVVLVNRSTNIKRPEDLVLLEGASRAIARLTTAARTPFIGDQLDDLQAAFHAGCPRILVKTGLGRKTLERGLPDYVHPVLVAQDLSAAVDVVLGRNRI